MYLKTALASIVWFVFSFLICLVRENITHSLMFTLLFDCLRYIAFLGSTIIWMFACKHLTNDYLSTKKYSYNAQDLVFNKILITFITLVCIDIPLGYNFANTNVSSLMLVSNIVKPLGYNFANENVSTLMFVSFIVKIFVSLW